MIDPGLPHSVSQTPAAGVGQLIIETHEDHATPAARRPHGRAVGHANPIAVPPVPWDLESGSDRTGSYARGYAVGPDSPFSNRTNLPAIPNGPAFGSLPGPGLGSSQPTREDHKGPADSDPGPSSAVAQSQDAGIPVTSEPNHSSSGTQSRCVGSDDLDQSPCNTHIRTVEEPGSEPSRGADDTQNITAGSDPVIAEAFRLGDALLLIYADALDDIERTRIASQNRVRALCDVKAMSGTPEEARLSGVVDALLRIEHDCELELRRALRLHPLGPWVRRTHGVGEKQGGRLLAAIGDPYWHGPEGRPRTVSELWAYCGYHVLHPSQYQHATQSIVAGEGDGQRGDGTQATIAQVGSDTGREVFDDHEGTAGVAPRRRRGQQANWNGKAKMRAYLVAESCMKHRNSPYRAVYDEGRLKYADSVNGDGKPLSDLHKHTRALRLVAKAVLRDLWIEARNLRELHE